MIIDRIREYWDEAKKDGYCGFDEMCSLRSGKEMNESEGYYGKEAVNGPYNIDSVYFDSGWGDEPLEFKTFEEFAPSMSHWTTVICEVYTIIRKPNGRHIQDEYILPAGISEEEAIRRLDAEWNKLGNDEKLDTVLDLALLAYDEDNDILIDDNNWFYAEAKMHCMNTIDEYIPITIRKCDRAE